MSGMTSEGTLSILDFPPEIREKIWKLVDQRSVVRARLVCQQIREDVDTFCSFSTLISFRPDKSHIPRMLELRSEMLQIFSLHWCRFFPAPNWNWKDFALSVPPTRSTVLKYPEALRELHLTVRRREGDFSKEHAGNIFDNLITSSATNLSKLDLSLDEDQLHLFSHPGGWFFEKLATLGLSLHTKYRTDGSEITIPKESNLFLQILTQGSMPKLRNISLGINLGTASRRVEAVEILEAYLAFVENDLLRKRLRKLSVEIVADSDAIDLMRGDFEAVQRKFEGVLKVTHLHKLDIWDNTNLLTSFWRRLILNQKGLQIMKLKLGDYRRTYPFTLYQQLILQHVDCLVDLELHGLQDFDLSVLSAYTRLKSLKLSRVSRDTDGQDQPDLVNLHNLPKTLTKLYISSFWLLTSELLSLFGSNHFPRLEELRLYWTGHSGSFGVTGGVLQRLQDLGKGRLTKVGIGGVNVTDTSVWREVEAKLNEYGCKTDKRYRKYLTFVLVKDDEGRWRND